MKPHHYFFVVISLAALLISGGCVKQSAETQTYKNDVYGYELSYNPDEAQILTDSIMESGTAGNPGFKFAQGGHMSIGTYDNPDNLSPRQWLDSSYADYSGSWYGEYEDIQVAGLPAVKATASNECFIEYILIPKDGKIFSTRTEICIDYSAWQDIAESEKSAALKSYRDIIQSLKFAN
ncbi:MAG: hypothetical protein ACOYUZ_04485 [Patescibacteria group bacterium]